MLHGLAAKHKETVVVKHSYSDWWELSTWKCE